MILSHKIALNPTLDQVVYFTRASGVSRFAWNWALARWQQEYALWREYRCGPKPSDLSINRDLNAMKADAFPWMLGVTKTAPQYAIKHLGAAFKSFFDGRARYPKFKKKGVSRDSFRADNGSDKTRPNAVHVDGKRVKLPVIGWISMREAVRFVGNIKSAIVSRVADRWFVSLVIEVDHTPPVRETQVVGGVDLGIKALATLSDGTVIEGPRALRAWLKVLRRRSRAHSRRVMGSSNRRKSSMRLARLHAKVANIRHDATHKATTMVVRKFSVIGIEGLNVIGMMANRSLALDIADLSACKFRRQVEYKAPLNASRVAVASRWFPSSRMCSACGHIHAGLTLDDREWICDICGVIHDRDRNAAINLMHFAASSAAPACGAERSGFGRETKVKRTAVKQEPMHRTPSYA